MLWHLVKPHNYVTLANWDVVNDQWLPVIPGISARSAGQPGHGSEPEYCLRVRLGWRRGAQPGHGSFSPGGTGPPGVSRPEASPRGRGLHPGTGDPCQLSHVPPSYTMGVLSVVYKCEYWASESRPVTGTYSWLVPKLEPDYRYPQLQAIDAHLENIPRNSFYLLTAMV